MNQIMRMGMVGIVLAIAPATGCGIAAEKKAVILDDRQFITNAAGGQQVEITLGHLATARAQSEPVKQFGQRMVADHQKASQEVKQLAAQEHIDLPADMPPMHKELVDQLSKLSGKEFDRAYITHMINDHVKNVTEFEEGARGLRAPLMRQWASATLPVVNNTVLMLSESRNS